jgi:hypothetical protein
VNWLTHSQNVSKVDGEMAIDATHLVLQAFGAALLLFYMPELENDAAICQSCGLLMVVLPDMPENPIAASPLDH